VTGVAIVHVHGHGHPAEVEIIQSLRLVWQLLLPHWLPPLLENTWPTATSEGKNLEEGVVVHEVCLDDVAFLAMMMLPTEQANITGCQLLLRLVRVLQL
jgi:hypothetical protein